MFEELLDMAIAAACWELLQVQQHACDTVWERVGMTRSCQQTFSDKMTRRGKRYRHSTQAL